VPEASLAPLIDEFVRRLSATPAPRGLPCLALESDSGTGTHLLDALSTHGIFRKYEMVLDLGGGLGGTGRWLAGRLGCTAVVTAADAADAAAGRSLTRRAGLRGRVHHLPAAAHRLPFGDARFTHVWLVETLPRLRDVAGALAEAYRVVRPGGHVAVQDLVCPGSDAAGHVAGRQLVAPAARRDALLAAGFVDVVLRRVTDAGEHAARIVAARRQFDTLLASSPGQRGRAEERAALAGALAAGRLEVVQLFGRRP
jgi:SAM-dependent methyltransferase